MSNNVNVGAGRQSHTAPDGVYLEWNTGGLANRQKFAAQVAGGVQNTVGVYLQSMRSDVGELQGSIMQKILLE